MEEEKKKVGRPRKVQIKKDDEVEKAKEDAMKEMKDKVDKGMAVRPGPQFINATKFRFIDISLELFREYVYPNGAKIRIDRPMKLSVTNNQVHRLFDSNGLSYYIPPGWISIVWKSKPGAPNFIM